MVGLCFSCSSQFYDFICSICLLFKHLIRFISIQSIVCVSRFRKQNGTKWKMMVNFKMKQYIGEERIKKNNKEIIRFIIYPPHIVQCLAIAIMNSIEFKIKNEKCFLRASNVGRHKKPSSLCQLLYLLVNEMCVNEMNDIEINVKMFFDSSAFFVYDLAVLHEQNVTKWHLNEVEVIGWCTWLKWPSA